MNTPVKFEIAKLLKEKDILLNLLQLENLKKFL
jgi:hypothetical protein